MLDFPQEGAARYALAIGKRAVTFRKVGGFDKGNVVQLRARLEQGFVRFAALCEGKFISRTVSMQKAVSPADLTVRLAMNRIAQGSRPLGGQVKRGDLVAHGFRFEREDSRQLFLGRHPRLRHHLDLEQQGIETPRHDRSLLTVR